MDNVQKKLKENPGATASLFSRIVFWWLNPLFSLGYKQRLEEDDLYEVLPDEECKLLGQELQSYWDQDRVKAEEQERSPSLSRSIVRCVWKSYSVLGIFILIEETIKVVQPLFLGKIIQYFETYDPRNTAAFHRTLGYAAGLSCCAMALTVLHHFYFHQAQRTGMKIRVALSHMIYKKALCLSSAAMGKTTTGQIVNLLSNDVSQFDEVAIFQHFLWLAPLQTIGGICLLWSEIGPSCLVGIAVLGILLYTQTRIGRLFSRFRSKTVAQTDSRIRIMNEVVSGMRIIKMYAWEKPFADLVSDVRRKEISMVLKSSLLRAINMASFFCASKVILFFTFLVYVLLGNTITASRVFVAMCLYQAVRFSMTLFFPSAVEMLSKARVSVRRIQEFLLLDEIDQIRPALNEDETQNVSVDIKDLVCKWNPALDAPTLQNVSLGLNSNELLAVIGPVGAGKSSLLSSILGELPSESGLLNVQGQLTYASQQPWIFPGTIRSNILFGKELNPQKYEGVLRACALTRDLDLLPDGDLTLIGDKGATLSGGQKARVNLARAVYQEADIYLLDDPLSAVDADVGKHLFEECICGLLANKMRILVTHQLQYLTTADKIIVLREGHMVANGTYVELQRSGVDFTTLLQNNDEEEAQRPETEPRARSLSQKSELSQTTSHGSVKAGEHLPAEPVQTVAEESREQGNIKMSLYVQYLRAGANILILVNLLVITLFAQVFHIMTDWWLAFWAEKQDELCNQNVSTTDVTQELDTDFYLAIFGGLTSATIIFGFMKYMALFLVFVKSVETLHNRMFNSILRAPVRFFDINPIGRVLNRFSEDIGLLDNSLPMTFMNFLQMLLQILGSIVVAACIIPWILIPVVLLLILFLFLRSYYLQTSRNIKRLEATTGSPVFSHLSSSLHGLWTIRAFGATEKFQNIFDDHQDVHSAASFLFLAASVWFAVRLDCICAIFVIGTIFGSLVLRDELDAGSVGLTLSYAVSLIGLFQWAVRQSAEVENMMTSVERVVEYTELESEAPWETDKKPPPDWPSNGLVNFDGVSFSYSPESPVVLHELRAMFRPQEKVGIVGRTGAGKSSLVSALFRLSEPKGNIFIDGVLTSEIGLHDLRQNMSIIPQDPVLFSGTMRENLDPFSQHTDEKLWAALEVVQLRTVVEELPGQLETVLAESGSNFSVGQRQLVCLARAVLRKNRILVIDEATANVDLRTDELIQQTIREKFKECTVLTIAHRLNTIIDSDRILVLDAGKISEYDEPFTLLQNPDGIFSKMVQQTGKHEAAALLEAAKQAYEQRSRPGASNGHAENGDGNVVVFQTAL